MGVFRVYPRKSNTIASGVYQIYNSGQNAVTDLWYGGGGTDTALARRNSVSRFIVDFDLTELIQKLSEKEINGDLVSSYRLKMTNAIPGDKILEPEYEFDKLDKRVAASFDLITFPVNKEWDEGRGYDMFQENYLVKQRGNPIITGYSNWNFAKQTVAWDVPGVYFDPTGSTFSGSVVQSGITFETASINTGLNSATNFGFITSAATTAATTAISATTIGNDVFVSYNPLSGVVSTEDWYNSIIATSFSGFGITASGFSATTFIGTGTDAFYLSANTAVDNINFYSTQHFDIGNENIDMDITDIVNDWLSGGSENYGLGVAYRRDYELMSTDTRYVASFYTEKTNSSFKPYIEVVYDQSFQDDRLQVSNNRVSRLFLYTFSGNDAVNYSSASTVDIRTMNGVNVYTGLTPTQLEKGVYYVDVNMSGATRGEQYKDVWKGVTFVPGVDQQDIEQVFTIRDNYYTSNVPEVNDYSITTYGIGNNSILSLNETHKVFVDLRVNYSSRNQPKTAYDLKYRIVMNSQEEVVPWTSVNQAVINRCKTNYMTLETGWLLHNQSYQIQFRVDEFGTKRVLPETVNFKVLRSNDF